MDESMMGSEDILSALANMSDEQILQLMQASNAPNRNAIVQQELMRAQGLQDAPATRHTSPVGATLGGMAQMLRTGRGLQQEQAAKGEQERLMKLLEDPSALRNINGAVGMPGAAPAAAPTALGGMEDLSAFVEPLVRHRLGQGGAVGSMGMDKQKMLAELLRSSAGAGDLSMLSGLV